MRLYIRTWLSTELQTHRLRALEVVQKEVWASIREAYRPEDISVPHPFQVGDSVYVRRHRTENLEPRWKGPFIVLLTTPTAVKVDGISSWIHASHLKKAPQPDPDWRVIRTDNPLKFRLCKNDCVTNNSNSNDPVSGSFDLSFSQAMMPQHHPVGERAQVDPEYCCQGSLAGAQARPGALTLTSMSWTSVVGTAALALIGATIVETVNKERDRLQHHLEELRDDLLDALKKKRVTEKMGRAPRIYVSSSE
ncbi:uncharacterized protein LOC130681789 [Manis pentadactyla]|uniref:uncharacterized protein LOC130681789 n=1 Tax=Manis pentadactyla TaxID=143292 RepID=UPI00255CCB21|nr:uncharacterized protein LOC130681789 [Manis pentadactyla]